jgi:hypothetical protein
MIFCTMTLLLIDVLGPSHSASNYDVATVNIALDLAVIASALADNLTRCPVVRSARMLNVFGPLRTRGMFFVRFQRVENCIPAQKLHPPVV